jgi:large subunit ribosomal protein L6
MSRIGNKPVTIVDGVKVEIADGAVSVEGPKGKLQCKLPAAISAEFSDDGQEVIVKRENNERQSRAFHGLTRALVQNMITGTKVGYEKKLEIVGVGYIGAIQNGQLQLRVGYANEIHKTIPAGLDVSCPDQTHVVIKGCDKQLVGQFAAEVRSVRKPEPYKGKGIRYEGEQVKIKPGKSAT